MSIFQYHYQLRVLRLCAPDVRSATDALEDLEPEDQWAACLELVRLTESIAWCDDRATEALELLESGLAAALIERAGTARLDLLRLVDRLGVARADQADLITLARRVVEDHTAVVDDEAE